MPALEPDAERGQHVPFVRCIALLKVSGTMTPTFCLVDVTPRDLRAMSDASLVPGSNA
jgi:hypothetical protein